MKKLCVCIPTCNRCQAVNEVLDKELSFFEKHAVDLFIFDSSDDGATKSVVQKYVKKGFKNLYYKTCDTDINSNRKVFMIYKRASDMEYDYVWVIHDHTVCNEEALQYILQQLERRGDFYLLKMQFKTFQAVHIPSLNEFLLGGAWTLNSFGTAIVKRDSFLKNTDWVKMSRKYLTPETNNYSHIGFYFERVWEMRKPFIIQLEFPRECFYDFMRYRKPSWNKEVLRICLECWGNTIMRLPAVYISREKALRTQDRWFLSKYNLLSYKKEGLLNLYTFIKCRKWMKQVIPENYKIAFWISVLPYEVSKRKICSGMLDTIRKKSREGKKLCLYGAGRHAFECCQYLKDLDIEIDAYLVSKKEGNPDQINGCGVHQAEEYLNKNSAFIIIAVLTSGVSEIASRLDALKDRGLDLEYMSFDV